MHGLAGAAAGADPRGGPLAVQRPVGDGRQPRADQPRARAERGLARPEAPDAEQLAAFVAWCEATGEWLDPYVEFMTLRDLLDHAPWPTWEPGLRDRDPERVAEVLAPLAARCWRCASSSGCSRLQWAELRAYAAERGVLFFGDLPIFVSHDSADVWASRDLFELDDEGQPTTVTGVPARLLRRGRPAVEQPALRLDGDGRRRVRLVARAGSPASGSSSTWSGSTTSAASRRPGTCRSRRRPPRTGAGSRARRARCSRRWSRRPVPGRWSPRTSA